MDPEQPASETVPTEFPSHWLAQFARNNPRRMAALSALPGDTEADVCIVGGGYTGLWVAIELKRADPEMDVVVLEAKFCGFGASGRNGGTFVPQIMGSREHWAKRVGRDAVIGFERHLRESVSAVEEALARESVSCDFVRSGSIRFARNPLEQEWLESQIRSDREWGVSEDDTFLLGAEESAAIVGVASATGARFNRNAANVDPAALVVGLREAAVRRGVRVYENTRVTSIEPRLASTVLGDVRAKYIVRATEAYSPTVGAKDIVPVHSSMLVTERLPEAVWDEINWSGRQSVSAEHPFLHLQRTSDDRITIGGDDARIPYKWASSTSAEATATENVHRVYREELDRLFPVLRDHRIETSWQGIFGAPRNWAPAIQFDRSSGVVVAGGYVGEGLTASYLAAKTVRDLLMGQDTVYARLPWVVDRLRSWEPEPLRAVGSAAIWSMRYLGGKRELRSQRASKIANFANRLAGHTGNLG